MFFHNDRREFDSRLGYHSRDKDISSTEPKAVCLQILSRVSLDEVNKKLEWFDSSFDQFQLFRSMVYRTCDITRNLPTRKVVSVTDGDDYFSAFDTIKGEPKQRRMESQSLKGPTISGSNKYDSSKNKIIVQQNSNSDIKANEHDKESDDYYKGLSVIADSVEINYLPSDSVLSDDLNVRTGEMQNKIKRSNWKNKIEDEDLRISPVAQACRKDPLKVLIYQRDTSRRIVNVEESALDLKTRLGLNWTVEILSHSENMSPCDVINSVRTATVLVTPHGFQSVLLLFQPLNSVIVEVHPSYYFKQEVYGFIQAGFRQNFNVARSYLAEESVPVHWTMKFVISFFQLFGYMTHECMHSSLCRNVARRQDVLMSKSFISRTADFLSTHFILKCPN